ncbi:hypothetical protein Sm713_08970 [Streptomyces sp. TS71-3]|nr:hypothetical protein Sm713_08970 [Streptomyces sp. TS71-3]
MCGEFGLGEACRGGELPPDAEGETVPELAGVRVPQGVGHVVVTVRADGLADRGVRRAVGEAAAERAAVFAGAAVTAGSADVSGAVDGAEGRCGQGDEEPGMVADVCGDAFAAEEACADQVEGVACVES